jgi:sterol desaturase/sphingolipid hydroxylase (fatty acid hydroxylase superfamily)
MPRLGVLEWVFNTPTHHRIHHASNPKYLDCNYSGVLIIFDRLFGTFTAERHQLRITYGLTHPVVSGNSIELALHQWMRIYRDLLVAKTWRDRFRVTFGAPT